MYFAISCAVLMTDCHGVGRVVNDPLRACRHGDAERHERECDEFFQGVPFVISFFGWQRHAANHMKGFTTDRRRRGVSPAQCAVKSIRWERSGQKTASHTSE